MNERALRTRAPWVLAIALPAGLGAQEAPGEGMPVDAPHMYEVSPEQAAMIQAARLAGQESPFLEVSGTGRVSVPVDAARVVFAVETEGITAAEASAANAETMTAVLGAVRVLELSGLELETRGYSLTPEYARTGDGEKAREIVRYRAQNHVEAFLEHPDSVGRVIDAATAAGANRVTSLTFEATDTEDARREALRTAVRRARAEAEAMADALGVELGQPIEVRGNAAVPVPQPRFRVAAMAAAQPVPTPVEAGDQAVTASVTIKYSLGGGG